jgi:sugar phosphate isomerase/epimerase
MNDSHAPGKFVERRRFLARLSAGAAAAAFGAGAAGRADAAWKMKLSCSSIEFAGLPIERACQRIAELGFEAIDIWCPMAGCPHLDDAQQRLGPQGLKELLERNRLKLYAFSVYVGGYPKYAELLGRAGGGVAIRGSGPPCPPRELTSRMKAFLDGLKPELELAARWNSYLAIENHGATLLDTLDSFKAFVELNRDPRLGLALAPYHIQAARASVEQAVAIAGTRLLFFYAWQHAPGSGQLPGVGPTDFTPWLAALAGTGYRWYVNPFMHGEPEPETMTPLLARSRDYLKRCWPG